MRPRRRRQLARRCGALPQTYGGGARRAWRWTVATPTARQRAGAADGGAPDGGVAADFIDSSTTCEGADQLLQLYVAEGAARPIHVLCSTPTLAMPPSQARRSRCRSRPRERPGTLETLPSARSGARPRCRTPASPSVTPRARTITSWTRRRWSQPLLRPTSPSSSPSPSRREPSSPP